MQHRQRLGRSHQMRVSGPCADLRGQWAWVCLLFFIPVFGFPVRGQSKTPGLHFSNLTTDQGLPDNTITAIFQDRKGFMWFGTTNGIARYDGYGMKRYKHSIHEPDSLSHSWVNAIAEDGNGTLWVATKDGLNRMLANGRGFEQLAHDPNDPKTLSNQFITCLYVDGKQRLWVGTREGFNLYEPKFGFRRFLHDEADPASLSGNEIRFIIEDKRGRLWVGSSSGLDQFEPGSQRFLHLPRRDTLAIKAPSSVHLDARGLLWVGTETSGLYAYDPESESLVNHTGTSEGQVGFDRVTSLAEDGDGCLWIGSWDKGLHILDRQKNQLYAYRQGTSSASIPGDSIHTLFKDRSGLMWVGTFGHGIGKWNPTTQAFQRFSAVPEDDTSFGKEVWSFLETDDGTVWLGTRDGLSHWNPGTDSFEHYPHDPQKTTIGAGTIRAILQADTGALWLGLESGLDLFDPDKGVLRSYRYKSGDPAGFPQGQVYALLATDDNCLWISTDRGGLVRFDPKSGSVQRFSHNHANSSNPRVPVFTVMSHARDGGLWIGSYDGLFHFDQHRQVFRRYGKNLNGTGLCDEVVFGLYQDQAGILWVGTSGGLNRFDPKEGRFTYITTREGLPDDHILAVGGDADGFIWLSHINGLTRSDSTGLRMQHFGQSYGLQGSNFNENAFHKGSSGRLYFGGTNGFSILEPAKIERSRYVPSVHITDIQTFYRSIPTDIPFPELKTLTLAYTDSVISLKFAALDYAMPNQNQFRYKLHGFNDAWVDMGAKHEATFTNLEPGTYNFHVTCSNRDGIWNEVGTRLKIVITPPPWKTRGAYALYLLSVVLICSGLYRANAVKMAAKRRAHAAIEHSEARLKQALWGSGDELWDWSPVTGALCRSNPLEILGRSNQSKPGRLEDIYAAMHPNDVAAARKAMDDCLVGRTEYYEAQYRMHDRNNNWVWILDRGKVVKKAPDGSPLLLAGTNKDVSSVRDIEEQLQLIARCFNNTSDAVIITDPDFTILVTNPAYTKVTGFDPDQVLGKHYAFTDEYGQEQENPQIIASLEAKGRWQGELWQRHQSGSVFPIVSHWDVVINKDDQASHYVHVFSDITLTKQTEARLLHLANYDQLTNLPNRTLFQDRLAQALSRAQRDNYKVVLLFLDLDHFKNINDSLGHAAGDRLLGVVAKRIQACLRKVDSLARLGGDEFTIVMDKVQGLTHIVDLANKVIAAIDEPFQLSDTTTVMISTSIGVSVFPDDGLDTESLVKSADTALYHAKKEGRHNYQFFTSEMNDAVVERLALENEIRLALEREEFILYYQPKYALNRDRLIGLEALVRWVHPEKGLIPPDKFIPIAEETGQIIPLGEFVLRQACSQIKEWLKVGYPVCRVAVNLSARQFRQENLTGMVAELLEEIDLPARYLELEITEGTLMIDMEHTIGTLKTLRGMGIHLSLDDFGTGYSSLSYLKRFPIHSLKIDRSFVSDLMLNQEDAKIVASIIDLAHSLNLSVVAEGVETRDQAIFLQNHGCEDVQGYLYSKPLPTDEVVALFQTPDPATPGSFRDKAE